MGVIAKKGNEVKEFTDTVWNDMPEGKYGWMPVADVPEEILAMQNRLMADTAASDYTLTDADRQLLGLTGAHHYAVNPDILNLLNLYNEFTLQVNRDFAISTEEASQREERVHKVSTELGQLQEKYDALQKEVSALRSKAPESNEVNTSDDDKKATGKKTASNGKA